MLITRNASSPSMTGKTPDNFTGSVRVDSMSVPNSPGRAGCSLVTFAPGARTVWHTHPAGQTIVIVSGKGWVQRDGGSREEVGPGDCIFFDAGERHWHGATADNGMSHIAITESVDGAAVHWLEPVTDAQYAG